MLHRGDHKRLFTHFKAFYVHRVQFIGLDQSHRGSLFDSYDPNSGIQDKPHISDKTSELALKKRTKLLGGADVKQVDIFLMPKVNPAKIEAKKKELSDREIEECTFSPQTLNYKGHSTKMAVTHGDRCKDLYSKKAVGWFKDKGHKTQEDYEFERSKDHLTFSPEIIPDEMLKKVSRSLGNSRVHQIKGLDKVRDRMERARQQQQEKRMMTERGMPSQMQQSVGRVQQAMNMQPQTSKFKSAFGLQDGSQINHKQYLKGSQSQISFHDSQNIDQSELKDVSNAPTAGVTGAPKNLAKRAAATLLPKLHHSQEQEQLQTYGTNQNNENNNEILYEQGVDYGNRVEGGMRQQQQRGADPANYGGGQDQNNQMARYEIEHQEVHQPNDVNGGEESDEAYDNNSSHRPGMKSIFTD